jgi:hypothetical protein
MANECSNCARKHRTLPDLCILAALTGVSLHGRCDIDEKQAADIIKNTNADMLWDDIGPIIDRLEAGYYKNGE